MKTHNISNAVKLRILKGLHEGAELELSPGEHTLGSDENCDIVLLDKDVASTHLRLSIDKEHVSVTSFETVSINKKIFDKGSVAYLTDSGVLQIGGVRLELEVPLEWRKTQEATSSSVAKPTTAKKKHGSAWMIFGGLLACALAGMATTAPEKNSQGQAAYSKHQLFQAVADLKEKELRIEPVGGYLLISGFVSSAERERRLLDIINASDKSLVVKRYQVVESLQKKILEFLSEPQLKADYLGNGVFMLSGIATSKNYREQVRRLENDMSSIVRIEHREQVAPYGKKNAPAPVIVPVSIANVNFHPVPNFQTSEGARYFVGGKTPDGTEVVDINEEHIVFSRGGETAVYHLATRQFSQEQIHEKTVQ